MDSFKLNGGSLEVCPNKIYIEYSIQNFSSCPPLTLDLSFYVHSPSVYQPHHQSRLFASLWFQLMAI